MIVEVEAAILAWQFSNFDPAEIVASPLTSAHSSKAVSTNATSTQFLSSLCPGWSPKT